VVVCDDHRVLTDALVSYLRDVPDFASVDAVYDGDAAVRELRSGADVLLLDLALEDDCDGLSVLEAVRHLGLGVRTLLVSGREDPTTIARGLRLGAKGFCGKDVQPDQLLAALRRVVAGEVSLPANLVGPVLRELWDRQQEVQEHADVMARLTPREQQVLRLLANGRGSLNIAQTLGLSPNTVRAHLRHVMSKLGVHSQLQAAAVGRRLFDDGVAY
jgi:DNA-binding NarL/FixJ family response regulator